MTGTLTATAVRVGLHVLLVPDGKPIPDDAIVYGPALADLVYRTFYASTHCRQGHRKPAGGRWCLWGGECRPGYMTRGALDAVAWTWGEPA